MVVRTVLRILGPAAAGGHLPALPATRSSRASACLCRLRSPASGAPTAITAITAAAALTAGAAAAAIHPDRQYPASQGPGWLSMLLCSSCTASGPGCLPAASCSCMPVALARLAAMMRSPTPDALTATPAAHGVNRHSSRAACTTLTQSNVLRKEALSLLRTAVTARRRSSCLACGSHSVWAAAGCLSSPGCCQPGRSAQHQHQHQHRQQRHVLAAAPPGRRPPSSPRPPPLPPPPCPAASWPGRQTTPRQQHARGRQPPRSQQCPQGHHTAQQQHCQAAAAAAAAGGCRGHHVQLAQCGGAWLAAPAGWPPQPHFGEHSMLLLLLLLLLRSCCLSCCSWGAVVGCSCPCQCQHAAVLLPCCCSCWAHQALHMHRHAARQLSKPHR
ncbi:hypothetical protein COO60DRAFT_568616 [Scenedesmus sp. NREL 46B-D3]|nr:hypothetical protein COO60DRAFT_568616 [Scenedesmus sp. NREL 46B-D3]